MFNKKKLKELKERVKLLELENERITFRLLKLENTDIKRLVPRINTSTCINELSYEELREKYRCFTPNFKDGL